MGRRVLEADVFITLAILTETSVPVTHEQERIFLTLFQVLQVIYAVTINSSDQMYMPLDDVWFEEKGVEKDWSGGEESRRIVK